MLRDQKLETAEPVMSTIRNGEQCVHAAAQPTFAILCSSRAPALGIIPPTTKMDLPTFVNLSKTIATLLSYSPFP